MASVLGKDIPTESQFFTDLWSFYKKYYIQEESDEYFNDMTRAADDLALKYDPDLREHPNKKDSFFGNMVLACVSDIVKNHRR